MLVSGCPLHPRSSHDGLPFNLCLAPVNAFQQVRHRPVTPFGQFTKPWLQELMDMTTH